MIRPASRPHSFIPLPVVRQSHAYDCGAAVVRTIAMHYGVGPEEEEDYIELCRTDPENGSAPEDLVRAAREIGLHAEPHSEMTLDRLLAILDEGKPVICSFQAWGDGASYRGYEAGHFAIAIGYEDGYILFQDPGLRDDVRGRLPPDEFDRRWHGLDGEGRGLRHHAIVVWGDQRPLASASSERRASTHIE